MRCEATTQRRRGGGRCSNAAKYGCLCPVHARQLSCSATGWDYRKAVRKHFSHLTEEQLEEAVTLYREDIGTKHPAAFSVGAYDKLVMDTLEEYGELSTEELAGVIRKASGKAYNNSHVGAMLGQIRARGRVSRRYIHVEGKRVCLWNLFVKM